MRMCGLNALVNYFNVKTCDMWEGDVTTRRDIWTKHICSLGFWDMREEATLQKVTLRRLWCISILGSYHCAWPLPLKIL